MVKGPTPVTQYQGPNTVHPISLSDLKALAHVQVCGLPRRNLPRQDELCFTFGLPVMGLGEELLNLIRRDCEGDAGGHLQSVNPNHFAVLKSEMETAF